MSYMKSTDSAVLQEFGRIMQEKDDLKKVAQVAQPDWKAMFAHQVGSKQWNEMKSKLNPAQQKAVAVAESAVRAGKSNEDAMKYLQYSLSHPDFSFNVMEDLPQQVPAMAGQPAPAAAPPAPAPRRAALSVHEKTADQKAYDVTGKEDMVAEAHPGKAMVEGELVENLNQQQDADLSVAEKSAKQILTALYKLAKRLQAEKNDKAYALVKETFLELSKSLKK